MKSQALTDATAELYCDFMEEIKRRTSVIDDILNSKFALPMIVAVEFCYLELRFICELIALASLTAHGDIPGAKAKRLTRAYQADNILRMLEGLHPKFYPTPGRQVRNDKGQVAEIEKVTAPYLTKPELQKLYVECGSFLHRGSLENVVKGKKLPTFDHLRVWINKVRTLLNHHQIQLADPEWQLWVIMQSNVDGKVHSYQMLRIKAAPTSNSI
ncbi:MULTISPECIES: hypothetical protein [unclassified Afipia]|uniref:hypothetical protein n=1 Tax=unclassified Afipia TaxID=2642050 RepID=UPI00046597D9|nr:MULTISPECIES: hypothetical protein [unclassified Afipia]